MPINLVRRRRAVGSAAPGPSAAHLPERRRPGVLVFALAVFALPWYLATRRLPAEDES